MRSNYLLISCAVGESSTHMRRYSCYDESLGLYCIRHKNLAIVLNHPLLILMEMIVIRKWMSEKPCKFANMNTQIYATKAARKLCGVCLFATICPRIRVFVDAVGTKHCHQQRTPCPVARHSVEHRPLPRPGCWHFLHLSCVFPSFGNSLSLKWQNSTFFGVKILTKIFSHFKLEEVNLSPNPSPQKQAIQDHIVYL